MNTNGEGMNRITVHQEDMGGWLRVFAEAHAEPPNNLAVYLSRALTAWFREHPHLHLRCIVGMVRDGMTVEWHAWYDQHLFPDRTDQPPSPKTE
jgi:hypothetical protein